MNTLQAHCRSIVESPARNKRILKISLSLTMAIAFTLPPQFANFLGTNPFLLGTVVSLRPLLVLFGIAMLTGFGINTGDISFAFQNHWRSAGVYCDRSGRDIVWNRICQLDSLLCTIDPACRYRRHHLWPTGTSLGIFCHLIGHMWLHPVQVPAYQSCYHFLHDS